MSAKSRAREYWIELLEKRTLLASSGLSATYYQNTDLTGASSTEIDPTINMNWGSTSVPAGLDPNTNSFSAEWTGTIQPQFSEAYTFQTLAAGGVRLWVNGQLLIDRWSEVADGGADANVDGVVNSLDFNTLAANYGTHSTAGQSAGDFNGDGVVDSRDFNVLASEYGQTFVAHDSGTISLQAGENYSIVMDFFQATGPASAKLSWSSNSQPLQVIPAAQLIPEAPTAISHLITDQIDAASFSNSGSAASQAQVPGNGNPTSDIQTEPTSDTGGGYDVSQLKPGDWMEYTINVSTAGTYDLNLRVASSGQGGTLHMNVDGTNATGTMTIPDTGAWQNWTTITATQIVLSAGSHTVRLVMDTAGASGATGSVNWFEFQPSVNPVLQPGTGFAGPTTQPAIEGAPGTTGYTAEAIARWDVVPYQTFDGKFNVGVIAFDISGIKEVDFSVNGGEWAAVRQMTLNPQTANHTGVGNPSDGVVEYWATLNASDFKDGQLEVRAIAYPQVGIPRVLQGSIDGTINGSLNYRNGNTAMFLSADFNQTLQTPVVWADSQNGNDTTGNGSQQNPFASVAKALAAVTKQYGSADGATVYLQPGTYGWTPPTYPETITTTTRWATVTAAPGVDPSLVTFVSSAPGGLDTRLVHAYNITQSDAAAPRSSTSIDTYFWFDRSVLEAADPYVSGDLAASVWSGVYVTDSRASVTLNAFRDATFVRNSCANIFSNSPLGSDTFAINVKLDDFRPNPNGDHADVFHWFWNTPGYRENRIIYGLDVTRFSLQGWQVNPIAGGGQQVDNVAFVNVHISKDTTNAAGAWWDLDCNQLLLYNVQLPDEPLRWQVNPGDADGVLTLSNVSIRNSVFQGFVYGPLPSSTIVDHVHFIDTTSFGFFEPAGIDVTTGSTASDLFVNPSLLDWCPRIGSVIDGRVPLDDLLVPEDLNNVMVIGTSALGAFAASAGQ